ncbi:MAG: phosphoribosylglycinamide formyltransferase [Bacteroidales bacterium]|nr:phosphoribosylglycinamide formyltransferase [Bacteroidales bacterium]
MNNIAIFASGSGTNAENIIQHFRTNSESRVQLVLCNKPGAGVIDRAEDNQIPVYLFSREDLYESDYVLRQLTEHRIDFIVLAGFLWLVPSNLIRKFPGSIVNIHPALLPKYGGKGMYGSRVHAAVLENHEKKSGITIHYVNDKYDEGNIIFKAKCKVSPDDTPDSLAEKVHELEYEHYPRVIEEVIREQKRS